jgi:hypothetical protein
VERLADFQVHGLIVADEAAEQVTGLLILAPNPCTTEPCLPGLAYAIDADGRHLFVTTDGALRMQGHRWAEADLEPGSRVAAHGIVRERRDMAGRPYLEIEVSSLSPAEG